MDESVIEYFNCPLGKAKLKLVGNSLVCTRCNVIFPVVNDIPSLIIEEAKLPEGITSISGLDCQKKD